MTKFNERFMKIVGEVNPDIKYLDEEFKALNFLCMEVDEQQQVFRHLYMLYGDNIGVLLEEVLNNAIPSATFEVTINAWGINNEHMELYSMFIEGEEDGYITWGVTIDMSIIVGMNSSCTIPCHELIDGRRSYIVL